MPGILRAQCRLGSGVAAAGAELRAIAISSTDKRSGRRWASSRTGVCCWCGLAAAGPSRLDHFPVDGYALQRRGDAADPADHRDEEFAELFLNAVEIPVENRVGAENDGWRVAQTTLSFERGLTLVNRRALARSLWRLVGLITDNGAEADRLDDEARRRCRHRFANRGVASHDRDVDGAAYRGTGSARRCVDHQTGLCARVARFFRSGAATARNGGTTNTRYVLGAGYEQATGCSAS